MPGIGRCGWSQILEAMLLPPLRLAVNDSAQRQAVMRLIGRIVSEPSQQIQDILHLQRAEVRDAFLKALQASLPHVPRPDLLWRMEFVWGALTFILCNPKKIEKDTQGECNPGGCAKGPGRNDRVFRARVPSRRPGGRWFVHKTSAGKTARPSRLTNNRPKTL